MDTTPTPDPTAPDAPNWWLHGLLFGVTFLCATISFSTPIPDESFLDAVLLGPLKDPARLLDGLSFSLPLMSILLAHEMGHYITGKIYGVHQSLPFFIPAPGTYFGTFGAVIIMRSAPPTRAALLNVAVMGPYAGLVLAVPTMAWGLAHSTVVDPELLTGSTVVFGSSLLVQALEALFSPNGTDVMLHPVGLAGWAGLLVTSLNLLPVGQLDGGHISYALTGRHHTLVSRGAVGLLLGLAFYLGMDGLLWGFWAVMLVFFGLGHPPVQRTERSLTRPQKLNAFFALIVFGLTFTPVPFKIIPSEEYLSATSLQNAPAPEPPSPIRTPQK